MCVDLFFTIFQIINVLREFIFVNLAKMCITNKNESSQKFFPIINQVLGSHLQMTIYYHITLFMTNAYFQNSHWQVLRETALSDSATHKSAIYLSR